MKKNRGLNPKRTLSPKGNKSLSQMLRESFKNYAKQPAVSQFGRTWTCRDLSDSSETFAAQLRRIGITSGQVVAVTGNKSFALLATTVALARSGAVLLNIDLSLPEERKNSMLNMNNYSYVRSAIRQTRFGGHEAFVNSIENMQSYQTDLTVDFEDGSPVANDLLDEIRKVGAELTKNMNWQDGDVIMVDNSRMLHGRRAFKGERSIATRFGVL